MFGTRRPRATYANVAATLALVVALSGTAFAAARVTSADIVNHTIQVKDIAPTAQLDLLPSGYQWGKAGFGQINGTASTVVRSISLRRGAWMITGKLWVLNDAGATAVNCTVTAGTHDPLVFRDIDWERLSAAGAADDTDSMSFNVMAYFDQKDSVTLTCNPSGGTVTLFDVKLSVVELGRVSIDST